MQCAGHFLSIANFALVQNWHGTHLNAKYSPLNWPTLSISPEAQNSVPPHLWWPSHSEPSGGMQWRGQWWSIESFGCWQNWQATHLCLLPLMFEQNSLLPSQWWWPSQCELSGGMQCFGHLWLSEFLFLTQYWQGSHTFFFPQNSVSGSQLACALHDE